MSIETRISRLVKKTGVKISRWTVPLSTNISTKIRKIPKSLLGMSIETGISRLMEKKLGVKKSRWTVPLMYFEKPRA
jgi:hypothetical protein